RHFGGCGAELGEDLVKRLLPGRLDEPPALAHQRLRQALAVLHVVVPEATLIARPDLVDVLVLAGHHALDDHAPARLAVHARVEVHVAADGAVRADRRHLADLPGARPAAEVRRRQRANGADVRRIARED